MRNRKNTAYPMKKWVYVVLIVLVISTVLWLFIKIKDKGEISPTVENNVVQIEQLRDCDVCPLMIVLPEGSAMMGSAKIEADRATDEDPQHKVSIQYPIAFSENEITFAQWDACYKEAACAKYWPSDEGWGRGNRPVINVSWKDAQAYIAWLRRKTGKPYRLPTESEWEYAMRAGTSSPFYVGACLDKNQANVDFRFGYKKCQPQPSAYLGKTQKVGQYPANPFGLHDMMGNVFEWVEDTWHESYVGAPANGRAWTIGGDDERRVVRGGSWGAVVAAARSANRFPEPADFRSDNVGFRVALSLPGK